MSAAQSVQGGPDEGLIVTPHPLATRAGAKVLKCGGTAAEAVVAAGAVLTVVCPHFCGLGGDGVWMLADGEGRRHSILGLGHAAATATSGAGMQLPIRGGGSALTTAGLVAGWQEMLSWQAAEWGGSLAAGSLLAEAQEIAREGYQVSAQQVFWTEFRQEAFRSWPALSKVFLNDGQPPQAGYRLRQTQLADTIATMRRDGLEAFYAGPLAARIAEGLAAEGAPIRASDLSKTRALAGAPLGLKLDDVTLFAPPPPTQGVTSLTIMGLLDRLGPLDRGTAADRLHLQVEAVKQAFLRRAEIADPSFASGVPGVPSSNDFTDMVAQIDPGRALEWTEDYRKGDTVFLAASDRAGRHVCALQSTYFDWGAGIMAGDTGVIWNNRGAAFSSNPSSPNCLSPGKRPFHTLNPGFAVWPDGRTLLYGTQGADGQPQTLAVLLSEILYRGRSPAQALAAPRFLLGRTFSDPTASLKIERDIGAPTLKDIAARGHVVAELPPLSPLSGQAGLILIEPDGSKSGAHDPRGDGTALVG